MKENAERIKREQKSLLTPIEYVRTMLSGLPQASFEMVIKEREQEEIIAPYPPDPNHCNAHDVVEGFRIFFDANRSKMSSSTFVIAKESATTQLNDGSICPKDDEEAVRLALETATAMFQNGRFRYEESEQSKAESINLTKTMARNLLTRQKPFAPNEVKAVNTVDVPRDDTSAVSQARLGNSRVKPKTPEACKKKKRHVLEMSLFGKIWTALDRMVTPNTRVYLRTGRLLGTSSNYTKETDKEVIVARANIFSEKILSRCIHHAYFLRMSHCCMGNFVRNFAPSC
jgi:hypothetical protein